MQAISITLLVALMVSCNETNLNDSSTFDRRPNYDSSDADQVDEGGKQQSAPKPPNPNCQKKFDLFFLVDSSSSMNCVGASDGVDSISCSGGAGSKISMARKLLAELRSKFTDSRASLISYNIEANSLISRSRDQGDFESATNRISIYDGIRASSNLHAGMQRLKNEIGLTDRIPLVMILTDGKSNVESYKVPYIVQELRDFEAEFHGIAVSGGGRVNMSELESISDNTYTLTSFDDVPLITDSIQVEYCK